MWFDGPGAGGKQRTDHVSLEAGESTLRGNLASEMRGRRGIRKLSYNTEESRRNPRILAGLLYLT